MWAQVRISDCLGRAVDDRPRAEAGRVGPDDLDPHHGRSRMGVGEVLRRAIASGFGVIIAIAVDPGAAVPGRIRRTGRTGSSSSPESARASSRGTAWALEWLGGWALALAAR